MHSNLHLSFDTVLDRFLVDFGSNLDPKTTPKSIQKSIQKLPNKLTTKEPKKCISYRQGQCFRAFGHVKLSTKIMKNRCNILPKLASKTMLQAESILAPTWLHFGRFLVPKLVPIWPQVALKIDPEKYYKTDHILDRLWCDFLWILGSKLGPFWVDFW